MSKVKAVMAAAFIYLIMFPALATVETISNMIVKAQSDKTDSLTKNTRNCVKECYVVPTDLDQENS